MSQEQIVSQQVVSQEQIASQQVVSQEQITSQQVVSQDQIISQVGGHRRVHLDHKMKQIQQPTMWQVELLEAAIAIH